MEKLWKKVQNDKSIKFMILLLAIMIMQAVRYFPFKFGGWNQIMLSFTYRYGFIQRAFIGTILDIESTLFHIPLKYMRYIYGIFTVAVWSFVCLFISKRAITFTIDKEINNFLKGLFLAFIIGPGWVSYYSNFGITDVWLALISCLSVYLVAKEKYSYGVILLTVIAELIHPGYVFLFFNFSMIIIVYKAMIEKEKFNAKFVWLFGINAFVASTLFFILFLFAHAKEGITLEFVMNRTAEFVGKTVEEIENHRPTISDFLFREGGDGGIRCLIQSWGFLIVGMMIVFFPFFYEIYRYWRNVYFVAKENKQKYACFFFLIPLGAVTLVPVYIMQNDYGRWTHAGLIYEVGIIVAMIFMKDKNVLEGTKRYMAYVKLHKWYYATLIAYAGICGAFDQNLINSIVSTIEQTIWKVIYAFA